MKIVGIDLAGSCKQISGFCLLNEKLEASCCSLHTDEEIISAVKKIKPDLIAIDAPLSLPKGRKSLDKKSNVHFRECDKALAKLHIKFFPITLGPMRMLTKRGIKLKKIFEKAGYKVIEVFPGATQDLLGMPRKQKGLKKLKMALKKFGLVFNKEDLNGDELDAATCSLTGWFYLKGKYKALGDEREGQIIIPSL